ncbi:MAG: YihY/virulence factor BrkB family protein [Deltaproteobacteria bacterium]|nr:YihY/virulence factor BrkB family protein [Deltaproteobacteria bacterium]
MQTVIKEIWYLVAETFAKWYADNPSQRGAAMAFYAIFAIAPLLVIAVALAGSIFGIHAPENQIVAALQDLVGRELASAIQVTIINASRPASGTLPTILGVLTLLIGALGVMGELHNTLNTIWHAKPQPGNRLLSWLKDQLFLLLMVVGLGFFLLLSLAASMASTVMSRSVSRFIRDSAPFWQWVDLIVSFGMLTSLVTIIYKVVPAVRIAWRDAWVGAIVTSALFTLGKWLIGWYLLHSTVTSAYGAAGSLIAILLWVYYSAQVCLIGAEFTWVYAHHYSSGIVPITASDSASPSESSRSK